MKKPIELAIDEIGTIGGMRVQCHDSLSAVHVCAACTFLYKDDEFCDDIRCTSRERKDGKNVHFKEKQE